MEAKKLSLSHFVFERLGHGHFRVTYDTKGNNNAYSDYTMITCNTSLINCTFYTNNPTQSDLTALKNMCVGNYYQS